MDYKYKLSLVIFTRDLRVDDNLTLIHAVMHSEKILPIFIFTSKQIKNNDRFNENSYQFMIESLKELETMLPIQFFNDEIESVILSLKKQNDILDAIYISKDHTPFAKKREKLLTKIGKKIKCHFKKY